MSQPDSEDPLHGTRYRTLRPLGMGNMGEVFLVEHTALGRRFVAKVLRSRHSRADEYVARLRREARTLGQIRHPHIVTVTDFDVTESGRPFIVMEHLEGRTLDAELRQLGRLPPSYALVYVRQVLSALGAAHAHGIIHRDVKPQNLFLHSQNGSLLPAIKVLDFGAARDTLGFAAPPIPLATSTGMVVGTPGYLSPEAANGQRVDLRADLYAVGLVLSVMLSGHLPSERLRRPVAAQIGESDLELPNEIRSQIAPLLLRALDRDPDKRFQSAAEFSAALPEH
ncbi:MAG TPA: serine/threonine-protein kinase [Polyangiaceae bacterium]|nr:serine/threonine-protein kinase [Polyangiaceae bacterium]